jgi:hypothetical protein
MIFFGGGEGGGRKTPFSLHIYFSYTFSSTTTLKTDACIYMYTRLVHGTHNPIHKIPSGIDTLYRDSQLLMNIEEGKEPLGGTEASLIRSWYTCFRIINNQAKWVPLTTAWRVLRLQVEELPPVWRISANILNKQLRTADKEWSSRLGVGRGANNS